MEKPLKRIWVKTGICDGEPFVAGTSVRVSEVLALHRSGVSKREICSKRFPDLTLEDVDACISYNENADDSDLPDAWAQQNNKVVAEWGNNAEPQWGDGSLALPQPEEGRLSFLKDLQKRTGKYAKYEKPIALFLTLGICCAFISIASLASMHRKTFSPSLRLSSEIVSSIAMHQGDEFYSSKKYEMAKNAYKHAKSIRRNDPLIENNLGMVAQAMNNTQEAEAAFRRASELSPNDPTYHYNLGLLYAKAKRYPEAELQFQKSLELKPDSDCHCNLGSVYFEESQFEAAASQYRKALRINPKNRIAATNLRDVQSKISHLANNP